MVAEQGADLALEDRAASGVVALAVHDRHTAVRRTVQVDEGPGLLHGFAPGQAMQVEAAPRHVLPAPQLAQLTTVDAVGDIACVAVRFIWLVVASPLRRWAIRFGRSARWREEGAQPNPRVFRQRRDISHRFVEATLFLVRIGFELPHRHGNDYRTRP